VAAFSASRNTVRLVLQRLAEQGLVTRGPKIGTTVRRSAVLRIDELLPIERWSTRGCMRGRVLETSLIPAFAAIRQRLSLPDGASVAVVEGLLLQDEIPLGVYVSYVAVPPDQAENLGKDRLSALDFLERHGVEIAGSDMVISALPADEQTAAQLLVPDGAPLLSIEDVLRDRTGRPWAVCQTRCRADRVVFSAPARHRAGK